MCLNNARGPPYDIRRLLFTAEEFTHQRGGRLATRCKLSEMLVCRHRLVEANARAVFRNKKTELDANLI